MSRWKRIPLWSLIRESREVVEPQALGSEVVHYSIPSFDANGGGVVEKSETIKSNKLRLRGGEVLISKLNPRKSRVILVEECPQRPMVASTEFVGLCANEKLEPRYLFYLLRSELVRQELDSRVQSVTRSHQRASSEVVTHLNVVLPDRVEQRRIANFLEDELKHVDILVQKQRRMVELLKERRESAVLAQITGDERVQRRTSALPWVDTLPRSWDEVRLSLLAKMGSGHTPSRSRSEWWENCTIPWITTGEVAQIRDDRRETLMETRESISEAGLANSAAELHPAGTVVLSRTASAGYSAIMGTRMATSQDFVTWTCGDKLVPSYLLWCLRAMRGDLLGRLAMGSTHQTIYVPDLQMLRIPLPSVAEQISIVDNIRAHNARIDQATDIIEKQIGLLIERRQALITAAVTGQIDVTTARGAGVS